MNRLRKEAEFHWRLEPYAGKPARTVLRGEDGSNVIFLLDLYKCTESLRSRKAAQYPSHYASGRTARYRQDISEKKVCADCIGAVKGYAWTGGGQGMMPGQGQGFGQGQDPRGIDPDGDNWTGGGQGMMPGQGQQSPSGTGSGQQGF